MPQKTFRSLISGREIKLFFYLVGLVSALQASATLNPNNTVPKSNQTKHEVGASSRIAEWHILLQTARHLSERKKLTLVNDFFNQKILFVNDLELWGKNDYWATPLEILSKGAGDCEDYSIAKYFTLKKLGISENKLRITYVKNLNLNTAHMILTYYSSPLDTPIILDNIELKLTLASVRKELSPLYSFNETSLWLAKFNRNSKRVGSSSQINMWANLTIRMKKYS